jgi:hypothetical protein
MEGTTGIVGVGQLSEAFCIFSFAFFCAPAARAATAVPGGSKRMRRAFTGKAPVAVFGGSAELTIDDQKKSNGAKRPAMSSLRSPSCLFSIYIIYICEGPLSKELRSIVHPSQTIRTQGR